MRTMLLRDVEQVDLFLTYPHFIGGYGCQHKGWEEHYSGAWCRNPASGASNCTTGNQSLFDRNQSDAIYLTTSWIFLQRKITNQRTSEKSSGGGGGGGAGGKSSLRDKKELGQRIVLLENRCSYHSLCLKAQWPSWGEYCRLDGVMTNFNATLAQNTEVRKEIDHLVQERSNFNDLIAKLQKKRWEQILWSCHCFLRYR